MKKIYYLLISFSLLAFSCGKDSTSSGDETKIVITVKRDGVAQNGALVEVEKDGGGFLSKTTTSTGVVEFNDLTPGIYRIYAHIEDPDYYNDSETITIADKETKNVTMDLIL